MALKTEFKSITKWHLENFYMIFELFLKVNFWISDIFLGLSPEQNKNFNEL